MNQTTVKAVLTKTFEIRLVEARSHGKYQIVTYDNGLETESGLMSDLNLALLVFNAKLEHLEGN